MRIFHFSDTHVGSREHFNEDALLRIFEEINTGDYDLVIHTGDITEGGQRKDYERAEKIFEGLEKPVIILPGNHDTRSGGLHLFEEYIGPSNDVREIGDAVVIYVNSSIADSNAGRVGRVKYNLIRDALNEYSDKPIKIIGVHHHILPIPMSGRERNTLSNAGDLLDLITRADVDMVLSGHRHYPNVNHIEGTMVINAGTASSRKTRYGDVNSYNIIEIGGETKRVETHRPDRSTVTREFPAREKRIYSDFGERVFRAVHVSNTFISNTRAFLTQHLSNALNTIRSLEPDLMVHCGGVVQEGIQQDYDLALRYLEDCDFPIIYTPAGRDINYLGYHLFNTYFGLQDQKYATDEMLFQGISSAQYDSTIGIVGETDRGELVGKMNAAPQKFKALFLHHNIIPIPHSREKGLLEDAGDFLREVLDADIDLVLTGTSSHPYAAKVDNTVIVNANSLSSIYQRSLFGNSFNLIDIYEGVIAVFEVNSLWGKRRLLGLYERNHQ